MGQWDSFVPWRGEWGGYIQNPQKLQAVHPHPPNYSFQDITEFDQRHRSGTWAEFKYKSQEILAFNQARHKFDAWAIMFLRKGRLPGGSASSDVLVFVKPGVRDAMLPKEDNICGIRFPGVDGLHLATRRENPCSSWKVQHPFWEKCLVFEVALPHGEEVLLAPYFDGPQSIREDMSMPEPLSRRCMEVTFELRLSTSTRDAELGALHILLNYKELDTAMRAFKYTMGFKTSREVESLFDRFPHMLDPISNPEAVPSKLVETFQNLNLQQLEAYKTALSKIPDGVCILPGGPGAGKTHFNLTVAAALLLKDEIVHPGESTPSPSRNKVVALIDVNKPLTELANKMHQLCGELGLTRKETDGSEVPRVVIRMFCWSYEKISAQHSELENEREELLRAKPRANELDLKKFTTAFRRAGESVLNPKGDLRDGSTEIAPTLDQAARIRFEKHKDTKYIDPQRQLDAEPAEEVEEIEAIEERIGKSILQVYRDALEAADVLVTTPTTASKFSDDLGASFQPSLVIFDEAQYARELTTLIAIANFQPVAWLFTGDYRQAKPYVDSYGSKPVINENVEQLRVSMMERAHVANPDMPSLLINHRAHGNLQKLASELFYQGQVIPAKDPDEPGALPPSTLHLRRQYIMPLKGNIGTEVSRLLVVLKGAGPPLAVQRSWYHPKHQRWAMNLVSQLLRDPQFLQTNGKDPGTVLIMSPYKQACHGYRKAIKELKGRYPELAKRVVEPRTVGTGQGHEADFVILDLVSDWITDHLEDPNKLCVALTRARQAEVILMHEKMARKPNCNRFCKGILGQMKRICVEAGEYVEGPASLFSAGRRDIPAAQPEASDDAESSAQSPESFQDPVGHCKADMQQLSLESSGW